MKAYGVCLCLCLYSAPQYMLCLHGGKFDHPNRIFNRFVKYGCYFFNEIVHILV